MLHQGVYVSVENSGGRPATPLTWPNSSSITATQGAEPTFPGSFGHWPQPYPIAPCDQERSGRDLSVTVRVWERVREKTEVRPNQSDALIHTPGSLPPPDGLASVPAVVFDHVSQLDDELALFVLLAALKGMFLGKGFTGLKSAPVGHNPP